MTSLAERNLAAETRALEEGHRCRIHDGRFVVVSDTQPGVRYELSAVALPPDLAVIVTCSCPAGLVAQGVGLIRFFVPGADVGRLPILPGFLPCKHAALVARRLERERLVYFDGRRWLVRPLAVALAEALG